MRKEIEEAYAPSHDTTFLMEYTYGSNGDVVVIECISWYCGKPNKEYTKQFSELRGNRCVMDYGLLEKEGGEQ